MDAVLESGVREALEQSADRANGKWDKLAALAVEGIRDGFWIQDARQQARWDYLCHCLATADGRAMLLGEWPEEQGFVQDPLNDDERELCRASGLWGEPGLCEDAPRFADAVMPFDLRWQPPESDDGDPFHLSNEPTTKGLAALRLAIVHDSVFIDDPILAMAIEQTADDWPVQCQLMVWQSMFCREDAELWRLFPEGSNPRRIKARLVKWETMVFNEPVESATDAPAGDDGDGQDDDPYLDLRAWVQRSGDITGKARRIVEMLIENGGIVPLKDLASDPKIMWPHPWDDRWSSQQSRINIKFESAGLRYEVNRNDNCARLWKLPPID